MKKTTYFLLFFLVFSFVQAQKKPLSNPAYKRMMYDMKINFYTVCDSAEAYFKDRDKGKGSGYKPYLRWRFENESKYAPSGNRMVDHYMPYNEYLRIKKENKTEKQQRLFETGGWKPLGPNNITNVTGHYSTGLGRVEFVEVDRNNDQQIYLGSRSGGLWRTSDGGATWSHNTDFLPASGVNAIAADPTNFNKVLINVRNAGNGTSFGVYKSTDGGTTFSATNFIPANVGFGGLGSNFKVYTIQYHPNVANLVFVGTSQGLYRSTDNLQTWTRQIIGGDVYDVDFHPINNNIIYIYDGFNAANKNKVLKSTDMGVTYSGFIDLPGNADAKLKISVSPTCPDCVFASSDNGIWKSSDAGVTYTTVQNPPPSGVALWQAMPNDLDTSKFVSGYVDLFRSEDSGTTFTQCTWWSLGSTQNGTGSNQQNYNSSNRYIHADTNYLDCVNGVFYTCTDGFLSKSSDNGITWQKLSLSVGIRENYCVGTSQSDQFVSICGSQDNGTSIKNESGWIEAYGADGMEGIVLPLNPNYMIGSTQNGGRGRYIDGTGAARVGITPPGQTASWVAPLFFDPNNQMTVYSLGTKVHKSTDFGTTWTDMGTPATLAGTIETAAIAENNSNIMVVTKGSAIELSVDGGVTFSNIKNGLPSSSITDVAFDPNDDATMIVTYDSYQNNGQKIYMTHNSGQTWQNITYNLGNMPIYSVVIDHTNDSTIYVGAAVGLYKKTMDATTWSLYNTDLPNVAIEDLEIHYGSNTIKAATWGRGLWEYSLANRNSFPSIVKTYITNPPTFTMPKTGSAQFVTSEIQYSGTLTDVHVSWAVGTPSFNAVNVIPMSLLSGTTWRSNSPLPDFLSGTKVFFKVVATGSNNDTSETYKLMYELRLNEFCVASGENTSGALSMTSFSCANLTNGPTTYNGYSYYNTTPIVMHQGSTYTATGNFNQSWSSNDFIVWIDYNNNLEFEPSERVVLDADTGSSGTGTFTIPNDAFQGNVRMRVRLGYWGDYSEACGTTLGEVEDYLVTIYPPKPTISFVGNSTVCQAVSNEFNYTGTAVESVSWVISNGVNTYNFTGNNANTMALPAGNYSVTLNVVKYGLPFSQVFANYLTIANSPTNVDIINANESLACGTIKAIQATGGNVSGNSITLNSGVLNLAIPDNSATGVSKILTVSGLPTSATITKVNVGININHAWLKDVEVVLKAPNGNYIALAADQGPNAVGAYVNTVITSDASAPVLSTSSTPITGTYRANATAASGLKASFGTNLTTAFSDLFSMANGDWTVLVYDDGANDLGTFVDCSITLTYTIANAIVWTSDNASLYTDASALVAYNPPGNYPTTIYARPLAPNATITATASFGDCTKTDSVVYTVANCNTLVNLKLHIQDYYDTTTNSMRPVKNNQDGFSPFDEVEDLTIALHQATSPYTMMSSAMATLHTDGTLQATFTSLPDGNYYIVVKGRNVVQTWSALPQAIGNTPLTYDFTTAASKAYGSNMVLVKPSVWAFYSGDTNQDEAIDNSDLDTMFIDIENSNFGVLATDVNGDGAVDNSDLDSLFINIENSVYSNRP
ncbi:hypothetical protein G4D82_12070 [Flavobacterium sp. CYK-4]|uniref:VPS10 domain-containing protein n=1 Tax=Flavobacterium lotistagni TaxID=2709660 RepID=UPI00140C65DA|nr:GEVED domain-containing protein [Flavobacterium lotistagni]NHM07961.1 hypothetical protein [Flavobacterium lotistagni]